MGRNVCLRGDGRPVCPFAQLGKSKLSIRRRRGTDGGDHRVAFLAHPAQRQTCGRGRVPRQKLWEWHQYRGLNKAGRTAICYFLCDRGFCVWGGYCVSQQFCAISKTKLSPLVASVTLYNCHTVPVAACGGNVTRERGAFCPAEFVTSPQRAIWSVVLQHGKNSPFLIRLDKGSSTLKKLS